MQPVELVYNGSGAEIWRGDSREICDMLGAVRRPFYPDLVLTDPPYGTADVIGGAKGNALGARKGPVMPGGDEPYDPTWLLERFPKVVLFGAVHFAHRLPPSRSWIVWDKLRGMKPSRIYGDAELAWTNIPGPIRIIQHRWMGAVTDSERGEKRSHGGQKPIAVMRAIIERFTEPGDLVLDPYCGTGATILAALESGRRGIGIELVPQWANAAASRLEEKVGLRQEAETVSLPSLEPAEGS